MTLKPSSLAAAVRLYLASLSASSFASRCKSFNYSTKGLSRRSRCGDAPSSLEGSLLICSLGALCAKDETTIHNAWRIESLCSGRNPSNGSFEKGLRPVAVKLIVLIAS